MSIILNKPKGVVCSKRGQGSDTIYDILDARFHNLDPAGRLDKDSSGLLLLTNDGGMIFELTHPKNQKLKIYEIQLDKDLSTHHQSVVSEQGVELQDGISRLRLEKLSNRRNFRVAMHEGRNRQIRRTFEALGYKVLELHRTNFGPYSLGKLEPGQIKEV